MSVFLKPYYTLLFYTCKQTGQFIDVCFEMTFDINELRHGSELGRVSLEVGV